ncbi:MAG: Omp28-related outer membrane protein [Ignavibacteriaceae bacterium]|nr:Omp28-related outer membrane protein [Ignavibacteriaceae bacterium]
MLKEITSKALFLLLFSVSIYAQSVRNPVLEYCTGTWCQYCPCGHTIIAENVLKTAPNAIIIGYHGPSNSSDPYRNFSGNSIISSMGFSSYPTGVIDRTSSPVSRGEWNSRVSLRKNVAPTVSITIAKTYNNLTRELDATLKVTSLTSLSGYYRVNFVLTEDNLVYSQTGNSSCIGGTDYKHSHVVRAMINGVLGDTLNTKDVWKMGQEIYRQVRYTVPAGFDANSCQLVAFVYKVNSPLNQGEIQQAEKWDLIGTISGNNDKDSRIPSEFSLGQNYPNPFNPSTTINFSLASYSLVTIKVYNILGREVATLVSSFKEAGSHSVDFHAGNLSSGMYIVEMKAGSFNSKRKITLLK